MYYKRRSSMSFASAQLVGEALAITSAGSKAPFKTQPQGGSGGESPGRPGARA